VAEADPLDAGVVHRAAEGRGPPCAAGLQFGSRYPGDPRRMTLHDFLPDEKLREVENLHDFAGMLVFDKWVCNTNGRQTVFFEDAGEGGMHGRRGGTCSFRIGAR